MPTKTWKDVERKVCISLGGTRNPLSGINSKHTHSDCLNTKEYVEIKHRKRIPFYTEWLKVQRLAALEKKDGIVVFHQTGSHEYIVMVSLEQYIYIKEIAKEVYHHARIPLM